MIKIKEKQVGIKGPKFSANAFLGGLSLKLNEGKNTVHTILKYQVTRTRRIKQRLRVRLN